RQELSGGAHERLPLLVLVVAGPFADEHHVGVRVPHAEHDLRAAARKPTLRARGRRLMKLLEGRDHECSPSRAEGKPAMPRARSTARLIASATTPTASPSSMRWSESTWPVARAKTVSPSHIVCAGRMAESMP